MTHTPTLQTKAVIHHYDSSDDLYPFLLSTVVLSPAHALSVVVSTSPPSSWHRRLGHPGQHVLSTLINRCLISCPKVPLRMLCNFCQLGKHSLLPFSNSVSKTTLPFQIIHVNLWTSPIPSFFGYKYYLVLIHDFIHYLWTYPLRHKSDVFEVFVHFHKLIYT